MGDLSLLSAGDQSVSQADLQALRAWHPDPSNTFNVMNPAF